MSNRHEINSVSLIAEKEESLGLINMDSVRAFGEQSRNSTANKNETTATERKERMKAERLKALEVLQKSNKYERNSSIYNKENVQNDPSTPGLNKTDYVPYRKCETIDISDLHADSTINLELTDLPPQSATKSKISFEPSEITGRSTHFPSSKRSQLPTVEQILASSCAPNVRSMCDSLRESYGGDSFSLPRTADMSKASKNVSMNSSRMFSFSNARRADTTGMSVEEFEPGELMQSKLQNDEISWEQEYAIIPGEVKKQSPENESVCSRRTDNMSMITMNMNDPNFSVGNYFDKRSEKLFNIVNVSSPKKTRAPIALVDESMISSKNISITPKPDNKTYSQYTASMQASSMLAHEKNSDSKDSGNATDNSYVLSVSAIERAIDDMNTDDTAGELVNQLLKAKSSKSCMNPYRETIVNKDQNKLLSLDAHFYRPLATFGTANKENFDPKYTKQFQMSDTVSFTDSVLDSSDVKQSNRSRTSTGERIPLSPIEIKITEATEADDEDFERTPTARRMRSRSRSPRLKSRSPASVRSSSSQEPVITDPNIILSKYPSRDSRLDSTEQNTPMSSPNALDKNSKSKSKSSTRLTDGDDNSINFSKSIGSLMRTTTRSPSPASFDSPISSPRSYISSQVSSPRWNGHARSPSMDTTTNSDRRFLVGAAGTASPDFGKMSLPAYGLPGRTTSTISLKSRCTSQCSNSSEFSHRDGKALPIKVTCWELSWGSIKLRTNSKKTMQIKNTSTKRLVLRVLVSGPGFQMTNVDGNLLTLQSQECRTIDMCFGPTMIGAAVGKISFSSPNGNSSSVPILEIPLYGYGGHTSLLLQGILKGPIGSAFLSMGELCDLGRPLVQTFKIFNKGPLDGFASVIIDSIGLDLPRLCECIEVTPRGVLIPPQETAKIRVTFKPRREDLKKIVKKINNVMTLANLRIICGDEPTRQRLRKLISHMKSEERSKISSKSLDQVWDRFPDERAFEDLETLKERSEVSFDLVSTLRVHECALTLNHTSYMDETSQSSLIFPDADETIVFRTIIVNSPTPSGLEPVDEDCEYHQDSSNKKQQLTESWSVHPNSLQFNPFGRTNQISFCITNSIKSSQYYTISCNFKHLFRFSPSEGHLRHNEEVEIIMTMEQHPSFLPNEQIYVEVYMQNERITVPVNIMKDDFPANFR